MTGGESRDLQVATATAASGSWSIACDTTSALGNHSAAGYRGYTVTSGATTGSCRATWNGSGVPAFLNANNNSTPTGNFGNAFYLRTVFNLNTIPASGSYVHKVIRIGAGGGGVISNELWSLIIQSGGVAVSSFNGNQTLFTPTTGTTYRLQVQFSETDAGTQTWEIICRVYAQTGTNPIAEVIHTGVFAFNPNLIEWGVIPVALQRGPFDFRLDDIAINNNTTPANGTDRHNYAPDGGTSYREQDFDVGATGTYKEWTVSAGTDLTAIEAGNVYAAYDDTDYIKSTNALPMRHTFVVPNYPTGAGWNTIKTFCLLVRHGDDTGTTGNDFFHNAGVYDGTNFLDQPLIAGYPSITPDYVIIQEKSGGGKLDATYFNGCQAAVRRTQDFNTGQNLVRISYELMEVEDDDGVNFTPAPASAMSGQGTVT